MAGQTVRGAAEAGVVGAEGHFNYVQQALGHITLAS